MKLHTIKGCPYNKQGGSQDFSGLLFWVQQLKIHEW